MQGSPILDFTHYQRCYVVFKNLPKLREEVADLEKKMKDVDPFHRALIEVLSNHVRSVTDKLGDEGIPAS